MGITTTIQIYVNYHYRLYSFERGVAISNKLKLRQMLQIVVNRFATPSASRFASPRCGKVMQIDLQHLLAHDLQRFFPNLDQFSKASWHFLLKIALKSLKNATRQVLQIDLHHFATLG